MVFQDLTRRLDQTMKKLAGADRLSEDNIKEALREVRLALLEADVNFAVAKKLVASIREKALGQEVLGSLSPAQQVVKIVNDELTALLGGQTAELNLDLENAQNKAMTTVMVMGLQGSGKTTFCGKLALRLKKEGRRPMLVAADIYRPAAIDQLHVIGDSIEVPVHSDRERKNAAQIVKLGQRKAKDNKCDVLIVDTAGRLHIDDTLMGELEDIAKMVAMDEKLLVLDAMTGQEAVNIAETFSQRLDFDGAILTKMDGDARGGAALSVLEVTGKPVKMIGVGEKMEDLEVFHPDRMAGRILGMGDVLSLIEKAEESMDLGAAENMAARFAEGEFNLEDFQNQIKQMKKLGPMKGVLKMLPGMNSDVLDKAKVDDNQFGKVEAIINSMTIAERRKPDLINGSRRKRIARGSGTTVSQVNKLLKQYRDMRSMMRKINSAGGLESFGKGMFGG
ncbi:MAG: signal recognition particle protein [Candidatus Krumholzibacteria bacterium]|nr:signal recognition particle protein [Candidatus Krumholzibacteria bacterium]